MENFEVFEPPADLQKAVADMLTLRKLPPGYSFVYDAKTDNLLCCGIRFCFVVTRRAVEQGLHLIQYGGTLTELIRTHRNSCDA